LTWEQPALQATFDQYLYAVSELDERIRRCDAQIVQYAEQEPWRSPVGRLRCFRGIDTLTALGIISEIEDFRRFPHASSLMGYLGFGVIEGSTGPRRITGGITKAGNIHVRRLLVEAAWHCRHKPAVGLQLRRRRQGQPESVILIADKAMHRLQRRFLRLVARGKDANKAVVAVARELAGFLWACEVEHAA
jgi:transposase